MRAEHLWSMKLESGTIAFKERTKRLVNPSYEPKNQEPFRDEAWDWFVRRVAWRSSIGYARRIGVLSLAQNPTDTLMWSHYGESWSGLVLGFAPEEPVFTESVYAGLTGPQKVRYQDERSRLSESTIHDRIATICLTKARCWSYENELRCFREITEGQSRRLVPFRPDSLLRIILGPNMKHDLVLKCIQLRDTKYSNAEILLATPNPSTFEVDLAPLPPRAVLNGAWKMRTPVGYLNPYGPIDDGWSKRQVSGLGRPLK